jgi:hypothetical protein
VYCPTANSINNIGIPHIINIIKYGIRKTPEMIWLVNGTVAVVYAVIR